MAVFGRLLARLGLVQLGKYGLLLTPDDRILSTRHAVLDDGLGGKIVGWTEHDLATMELGRWGEPRPMVQIAPPLPRRVQAPIIASTPVPKPAPLAVQVAPAPAQEEDEWEWEIAVARARAAADPIPADQWPKTEELHEDVDVWEATPAPRHLVVPHQRITQVPARTTSGKTVIPVPALPAAVHPSQIRPVARPRPTVIATPPPLPVAEPAPTRYPRATSRHEETIRTYAAPPANDDRTSPSIVLPPAPVASSSRRVAAKQR